mgnify:FL=1
MSLYLCLPLSSKILFRSRSAERSFTILPNINLSNDVNNDTMAIWLDDTVGLSLENRWLCMIEQLRQIIPHVEIFKDAYECSNYISSSGIELIFLIITGTFLDNFDIDLFKEHKEILLIYILSTNTIEVQDTNLDIRGCFTSTITLLEKIKDDYANAIFSTDSHLLNLTESTTRFVNPELIKWKCMQLTMDLFGRIPCEYEESKKKFVELWKSYYFSDSRVIRQIDEFEKKYAEDKAVHWYTRDSFPFRLVNSNMRIHNVDAIMTFSFFINDLCNKLNEIRYHGDNRTSSSFTVYRGCVMHLDELQEIQNNIGAFVSNNSILSTTMDFHIGRIFSEDNHFRCDPASVIFEISIPNLLSLSKSFAYIAGESHYSQEEEVLFAHGHVFRIESCELFDKNKWYIKLTLCDDSHPLVENSTDYFDLAILQLIEILSKISPRTNEANDKMLELWRFYCKNDRQELAKIDEFEKNYRSDAAVRWYTKDSILYRLLNAALRQENIDIIIDFRYFIIDLYNQLTTSHMNYVRNFTESKLTVYRGQKISLSELIQLKHNIGKYITMKSFFSASKSSCVALKYAELSESEKEQNLQSILCQIDIDMEKIAKSTKNQIFANIMNMSWFVDEDEVLFMANTQFRLKSITKWTDQLWVIELTLLNQDDENNYNLKIMNQYFDRFAKILNQDSSGNALSFFKEQLLKKSKPFHFIR